MPLDPSHSDIATLETQVQPPAGYEEPPHGDATSGPDGIEYASVLPFTSPWELARARYGRLADDDLALLRALVEHENPDLDLDAPLPAGRFVLPTPELLLCHLFDYEREAGEHLATEAPVEAPAAAPPPARPPAGFPGEPVPGVHRGDRFPAGRAALTFDDGPHAHTPEILDILAAWGARATFFVVGRNITADTYPLLQRMVREGHALANHTYSHDTLMARLDAPRGAAYVERELVLAQTLVDIALLAHSAADFRALHERLLGTRGRLSPDAAAARWPALLEARAALLAERSGGAPPLRLRYSRPPGGSPYMGRWSDAHRASFSGVLRRLGLMNVLWTGSSGDSDGSLPQAERFRQARLVGNVVAAMRRGGVVLLHDRIPPRAVSGFLEEIGLDPALAVVTLDDVITAKYGAPPAALEGPVA